MRTTQPTAAASVDGVHRPKADRLVDLRTRLLARAYLFDEPEAYAAGVEDTLEELLRA